MPKKRRVREGDGGKSDMITKGEFEGKESPFHPLFGPNLTRC